MRIKRFIGAYKFPRLSAALLRESAATSDAIYSWPKIRSIQESVLQTISPGVTYQRKAYQTSDGPIVVHETWVDLTVPTVRLRTVMSHDRLENERNETLREMGQRTGALAGINGDFFESGTSGMALNMTIDQGKLLHHPSQAAVFGVDAYNRVAIGKFDFSGQVTAANGQPYALSVLNGHPVTYPNALMLLTSELGHWEMATKATVLTLLTQGAGRYKVTEIQSDQNVIEAPYPGSVKLVAQGGAIAFVQSHIKKDDEVQVTYGTIPSSSHLQFAIGGGPIWIRDGNAFYDPNPPAYISSTRRDPQTGVGVTADGFRLLMVVVDGRSRNSIGLTQVQMANYLAARGLYQAMLFDGGGSSEMVVRLPDQGSVRVVNNPSDGGERRIANGLFVFEEQPATITFPDIAEHWAREFIETLATKNIVYPVVGNLFVPNQAATRAEVVTFLVRALNLPPVPTSDFSDVPPDVGYNGAVGAAVQAGIARGYGDGRFDPAGLVDRNMAAVMFNQALRALGKSTKGAGQPIAFQDRAEIPLWAINHVDALSAGKLMVGDGDGLFKPTKQVTRAEASVLTYRIMQYAGLL